MLHVIKSLSESYFMRFPMFLFSFMFIILVTLGCSGGGSGEDNDDNDTTPLVKVSGYVLDINGNPISGAKVTISSDSISVYTDNDGYFSVEVETGDHEITITYGSITIYSSTFNCEEGNPLHMPEISTSYDPDVNNADNDGDGYTTDDCDDSDAAVNPGQTEVPYNGKDDDCSATTPDDDLDQDGYLKSTDCDDADGLVHPGATEICDDQKDNDCDGDTDTADSDCNNASPTLEGTVLYFESGRMLSTTELNGTVFEGGFSFSGWFYFINFPAENGDIIIGNEFCIIYPDKNSVHIQLKNTGADIIGIAMEKWINLAVSYDLSTVNYFVNGALVETAQASGPFVFNDDEGALFSVGSFGEQSFYGYASQIKIWSRGLSIEEVKSEINRADSSNSEGIENQWLFNEGRGNKATDSVGGVDFDIVSPYWVDLDGPYEIVHDSIFRVTEENKLLPFSTAFGSADFNQDGHPDLFYHGSIIIPPTIETPLLVLENDGAGKFSDASDSLVDGGLYFKHCPSGRETIIADLNDDGIEDVFIGNTGMHGPGGQPEASSLLLSHGNSGKLYPSENTIMSPPCTLSEPEFSGQKPCSADIYMTGDIYYPDNSAPLVPIDVRIYNHGSTAGDIDKDGDIDIFVGNYVYGWPDILIMPIQSYFLINDGKGNFTANWQMVPNKAFLTVDRHNNEGDVLDKSYIIWKLKDFDGDGFLDLLMLGGGYWLAEHQPSNQFDVEQEYWDASVHDLIAWGTSGGFSETYTILDEDSFFDGLNHTAIAADIDMDGDIDIIATRQTGDTNNQYLQVYANNGDRTFTDITQQSIPQDREIAKTLSVYAGEMREIDFNGDQCPDFFQQAFGLEYHPSIQPYAMWLNNCKGYFTPIERRFVGKMGLMIPLDADGDGDIDFVTQTTGGGCPADIECLEHTLLRRIRDINMDKYIDTDRDGIRDIDDIDDDNDGVNDSDDAFPKDQYES